MEESSLEQKKRPLQITLSALMAQGMHLTLAKRVYVHLAKFAEKHPEYNQYDILIAMGKEIAIIL